MKRVRILTLLLALLLLLSGCAGRFSRDEDGYGYTDAKTDRHYAVLDATYEAAGHGESVGEYLDREHDVTRTFYEIPGLDSSRFLTDGSGTVYCADEVLPDATRWTLTSMFICEEDAVSFAKASVTEAAFLAEVHTAWFLGESCELPLDRADFSRRIKLVGKEYTGLYYCFRFFVYEDGTGYFYHTESRRAVLLSSELTARLLDAEGVRV